MTTTTDVLRWADLTDDAKRTVLEANMESCYEDLGEDVKEVFARDLEYYGLDEMETYWSLGYCQGDGVSFVGTVEAIDITDERFLPVLAMLGSNKESAVINKQIVEWPRPITAMTITITSGDHHYCHAYTMRFDCVVSYDEQGADVDWDGDDQVTLGADEPVTVAVKAYFIELAQRFEKTGYEILDDDMGWGERYFEEYGFDEDGDVIEQP